MALATATEPTVEVAEPTVEPAQSAFAEYPSMPDSEGDRL